MENDFLKLIETRRSCRKYKPEQIKDEELAAVLRAGTFAPTGMGQQSPFVVAVQNPEMKAKLEQMNADIRGMKGNPYYDAPTYVLVFAPLDCPFKLQDGTCVLENMMLAAHALGLGSCWIQIANRLKEDGTSSEDYVRNLLSIPDEIRILCIVTFGKKDEDRKPYDPEKCKWEKIHIGKWRTEN